MDEKPHLTHRPQPAGSLSPQQTNKSLYSCNTTPGVGSKEMLGAVWAPGMQKAAQVMAGEEGPPRERDPVNEGRTRGAAMEPRAPGAA